MEKTNTIVNEILQGLTEFAEALEADQDLESLFRVSYRSLEVRPIMVVHDAARRGRDGGAGSSPEGV